MPTTPDVTDDFYGPTTLRELPLPVAPRRRPVIPVVAGGLALAALATAAVVAWPDGPRDTRPVVLPPTLGGLPQDELESLVLTDEEVAADLAETFDGRPAGTTSYVVDPSYGSGLPSVYLAVSRGEFGDVHDAAVMREPFTWYGPVRCTSTLHFEADGEVLTEDVVTDDTRLCSRVEEHLTVTVLAMYGARDGTPYAVPEADVAAMVDEAWALNSTP